jgi:hypothetical protein
LRVSVIVNIFSSCLKEKGANPLPAYIYIQTIIIVFSYIMNIPIIHPSAGMVDSAGEW